MTPGESDSPAQTTVDAFVTCGNKLCRAEATNAITVQSVWMRDRGTDKARPRRYALCDRHYASYLPRGAGYLDRQNSVRLRIQCAEAPEGAVELLDRTRIPAVIGIHVC